MLFFDINQTRKKYINSFLITRTKSKKTKTKISRYPVSSFFQLDFCLKTFYFCRFISKYKHRTEEKNHWTDKKAKKLSSEIKLFFGLKEIKNKKKSEGKNISCRIFCFSKFSSTDLSFDFLIVGIGETISRCFFQYWIQ